MKTQYLEIRVSGLVQGVSYRYYTKQKADELGVCGIVRNERDGSVYIEVLGGEKAIDSFISWCHQGSPWAEVKNVDVRRVEKMHLYSNFEITY